MKAAIPTFIIKRPQVFGFVIFIIVFVLTEYLTYQRYLIAKDNEQVEVLHEINSVKDRLKTALNYDLTAAKTLAFIVENYGVPKDFDRVAKAILSSNKNIDAIQLTEKGVITHVYPMKGNEAVIGYDISADKKTKAEAWKAFMKKDIYFAGPLKLKQGGVAVIGRLPIYRDSVFFGFSAIIVKLPTLLKAAGIDTLDNTNFIYQLSKVNPSTQQEEFFLSNSAQFDKEQSVSIDVPDGAWKLYVMSKNKNRFYDTIIFSALGFGLALMFALFAWYLAKQPEKLNILVEEKTSQLRQLTSSLQNIREEERTRIAREIHDELGQQLTGLKMDISWIDKKLVLEDPALQKRISDMISLIDDTIITVRRIASELRPSILDDLGLITALEWQTQEFEKRTMIKSVFKNNTNDFNPERELSTTIFRVYQEALTNIMRHAQASLVETTIEVMDNYVSLIIKDNGCGFDVNEVKSKNSLGLIGMNERVLLFDGILIIESQKSKGTTISLKIPLFKKG